MIVNLSIGDVCDLYTKLKDENPILDTLRRELVSEFYKRETSNDDRKLIIATLDYSGEILELFETSDNSRPLEEIVVNPSVFRMLVSIALEQENDVLLCYAFTYTMPSLLEAIEVIAEFQDSLLSENDFDKYKLLRLRLCNHAIKCIVAKRAKKSGKKT